MLKRLWYAPFRSSTDNNTKIPPTKVGLQNFLVNAVLPWYIWILRQKGKNQGTISDPEKRLGRSCIINIYGYCGFLRIYLPNTGFQ